MVNRLKAVYSCFRPRFEEPLPGAAVSGFFISTFDDRQGALADGLHGLNPKNTGSRYTPSIPTSVG